MGYKLGELAELLGAELHGDPEGMIERVSTLAGASPGALSFLHNRRYRTDLTTTRATAVVLAEEFLPDCPTNSLVLSNPYVGYAKAAAMLTHSLDARSGVHPSAQVSRCASIHESAWIGPQCAIGAGAQVDAGVSVGPGCVLEGDVQVGADSTLVANVTLYRGVRIGRRVLVHPGAVIGADGFGIANDDGVWVKVPQLGGVRIGDDVEIGANTTIDRGALEDTVLEDGVKLDNLIQIGHNVQIGAHTAIAACVAIGGSARIGRRCTIGGAASLAGHLEIADDVHLTATTAVPNSIARPGVYSSGMPVQENRVWRKNVTRLRQLDDMARRLRRLEDRLRAFGHEPTKARKPGTGAALERAPQALEIPETTMADMDIKRVLEYLPHRYPMLLIDRVLECTPGESLIAIKNVSYNEPYFSGHFPVRPVMPAVLILEAMIQATGILALRSLDRVPSDDSLYYFVGVDRARFRQPVEPGDQLRVEVKLLRLVRDVCKVRSEARVNGELVADAELMGALRESELDSSERDR